MVNNKLFEDPTDDIFTDGTFYDNTLNTPANKKSDAMKKYFQNFSKDDENKPVKTAVSTNKSGDDGIEKRTPTLRGKEKEVTTNTSTGVDDVKVPGGEKPATTIEEPEVKPGGTGLEWIQHNWKAIAIVAGIGTLIALLAKSAKSIKMRYNKAVRTLARMQKDFTINKKGMNMRAVLPGVGSRITDNLTHVFSGSLFMNNSNKGVMSNKSAQKLKDGTIGLYPFCDMYKEEINNDFKMAQKVYSNIKFADDQKNEDAQYAEESFNGKVYNSFAEAFAADHINESETSKPVNESIMSLVALAPMIIRGGMFIASKLGKNGKVEPGSERAIQVTKQSTREMCYAIMNNFFEKYISFEELSKKMGVDVKGLSDIDASSVEKFKTVLRAYSNPDGGSVVKQYARLKEAYDKMCKHYFNIGDGIISNFKKYTKAEDEKHANLLIAANEKLLALWDQQRDQYKNLFPYVLNEITTNSSYQEYIDFIIEKVLPVFGSGNAGDADYILDVMPKKGDLFLLSQTGKDDNGNKAIAIVTKEYKADKKDLEIKFVGLFQGGIELNPDGSVVLTELDKKLDRKAFGNKPILLPYSKFVALDPRKIFNTDDVIAQYGINKKKLKENKQKYIVKDFESNPVLRDKSKELHNTLIERGFSEKQIDQLKSLIVQIIDEKQDSIVLKIVGMVKSDIQPNAEGQIPDDMKVINANAPITSKDDEKQSDVNEISTAEDIDIISFEPIAESSENNQQVEEPVIDATDTEFFDNTEKTVINGEITADNVKAPEEAENPVDYSYFIISKKEELRGETNDVNICARCELDADKNVSAVDIFTSIPNTNIATGGIKFNTPVSLSDVQKVLKSENCGFFKESSADEIKNLDLPLYDVVKDPQYGYRFTANNLDDLIFWVDSIKKSNLVNMIVLDGDKSGAYVQVDDEHFITILPVMKDSKNIGLKCALNNKVGKPINTTQMTLATGFLRKLFNKLVDFITNNKSSEPTSIGFLNAIEGLHIKLGDKEYEVKTIADIDKQENEALKNAFNALKSTDVKTEGKPIEAGEDISGRITDFVQKSLDNINKEHDQKDLKDYIVKYCSEIANSITTTNIEKPDQEQLKPEENPNDANANQQQQQDNKPTDVEQTAQGNETPINSSAEVDVDADADTLDEARKPKLPEPNKKVEVKNQNIEDKVILAVSNEREDTLLITFNEIIYRTKKSENKLNLYVRFYNEASKIDMPQANNNNKEIIVTKIFIGIPESKKQELNTVIEKPEDFAIIVANAIITLCGIENLTLNKEVKTEALNDSIRESFNFDVNYTVNMTESANFDINVTRNIKCNGNCSEYYILSEAIWADGNIKEPKSTLYTNMRNLFKRTNDKDSIMEYAKSIQNVNICKYAPSNTYDIKKSAGFAGNIGSPLYECCVALKFNDNGKIVNAINIGVHKISF